MVEVHPFRGWRYDVGQVGALSDVTAPPYDVINSEYQEQLYKQHPCNVVRLILNRAEPGDESSDLRYSRAADFLRHWQSEGVLSQEREEAFYVYHQVFDWEGVHYERKGFLGRVRLEEFGKGEVYPHEQTMSGPKADRLALTKACEMNLSPIFGLYPDPEASAQTPLEASIQGQTAIEITDPDGVLHRFWPVTDHSALSDCRAALRERPIFIADGHHRYETACNYQNWLKEEGKLGDDSHPGNFVLMHFVGMSDPGLAILPTHRLVAGLPELTSQDVRDVLSAHFDVEEVGSGSEAAAKTWEMMQSDGGQDVFGFGSGDGQWIFARLTDPSPMAELAAEQSENWKQLGVSILHRMILDKLFAEKYSDREIVWKYVHLMEEVTGAQASKSCQLACLVAPAGIDHVENIASKFEKMPPKSTFFYPKLLSGLVFNPLS